MAFYFLLTICFEKCCPKRERRSRGGKTGREGKKVIFFPSLAIFVLPSCDCFPSDSVLSICYTNPFVKKKIPQSVHR